MLQLCSRSHLCEFNFDVGHNSHLIFFALFTVKLYNVHEASSDTHPSIIHPFSYNKYFYQARTNLDSLHRLHLSICPFVRVSVCACVRAA